MAIRLPVDLQALSTDVDNSRWMLSAACVSIGDPDLFFDVEGDRRRQAKRVCARCPVREECLAFALSFEGQGRRGVALSGRARAGLWGGLGPLQRQRLAGSRRG